MRISYLWRPMLPDPEDDLVLETAVNARVEAVITFNRRHFEPAAARFGIEMLAPAEAMRRLEVGHEEEQLCAEVQPALMEEAKKVAKAEGVAVNQLINVAVAEKVSALRTQEYFAERAARGDLKKALQVLKRAGKSHPPLPGDELPAKPPRRRR